MDVVDLDKLATIIESPVVTEARRRRFAAMFARPVETAETAPEDERLGCADSNVAVGPWPNAQI
jgi:hypothetical protein